METGRPTRCRVLVRGVHPPMLGGLVETLLRENPDLEVVHAGHVDSDQFDLVIEGGAELAEAQTPRLSVDPAGVARIEFGAEELSRKLLRLAVDLARGTRSQRTWIELLLEACQRIDALVEEATELAREVYGDQGAFDDWRVMFLERRLQPDAPPLSSEIARESASAEEFLASITRLSRFVDEPGPASSHPVARLVSEYGLDGRQVDILLLCLVHELDARYGRRYAYLQQDPNLQSPTVDLIAALLAIDASDRLALQGELLSGPLVEHGLINVGPSTLPQRLQVATLDMSVLKLLLGDEREEIFEVLIDPRTTPRAEAGYILSETAREAAAKILGRVPVHIYGGVAADRRAAALDIAYELGKRLLVVDYEDIASDNRLGIGFVRRECIRLTACCLVEGVPTGSGGWQRGFEIAGPLLVSAGNSPAKPVDRSPLLQRWNLEIRPHNLSQREQIWDAAVAWTGVRINGGTGRVSSRHGVSVDRAAAALAAAAGREGSNEVTPELVVAALSEATADDAGGLLHTIHPRVRLEDLIVSAETERALRHALARIQNRDLVVNERGWDQRTSRLTGTYLLFAGPPGTGKTLAAEAIAAELGLPVQYLEISSLFSRWVGEFEAAVDKVFSAAEASNALLVVNEADAILGPRTEVVHGQDRYANAGTSHILSRLEQFTGHVIFTSNLVGPNNIDPAFHRRLTATIRFYPPDEEQRGRLWTAVWPTHTREGREVAYRFPTKTNGEPTFSALARDHAISGGSIANIAKTAAFLAAEESRDSVTITKEHLEEALHMELRKVGDFRSLMTARRDR